MEKIHKFNSVTEFAKRWIINKIVIMRFNLVI